MNYLGAIEADVGYTSDTQRINQVMVEEYLAGIERALVAVVSPARREARWTT